MGKRLPRISYRRKKDLASLNKSKWSLKDTLSIIAVVLSICGVVFQIYLSLRGADIKIVRPQQVTIFFNPCSKDPRLQISLQVAYYNSARQEYRDVIVDEELDIYLDKKYVFERENDGRIESNLVSRDKFIEKLKASEQKNSTTPICNFVRNIDNNSLNFAGMTVKQLPPVPVVVSGNNSFLHEVIFGDKVLRMQQREFSCEKRKNCIAKTKFLEVIKDVKSIRVTIKSTLASGKKIFVDCYLDIFEETISQIKNYYWAAPYCYDKHRHVADR